MKKLSFAWYEWALLAVVAALLAFAFTGCTQAQVDRAEAAVVTAKDILAKAEQAQATALQAVEMARKIADEIGSEKAKEVIAKADEALAKAAAGVEVAKGAVAGAENAAAAAKTAQVAGGSTIDVLLAAVGAFLPGAGAALLAFRKAATTGRALRQTVEGVESVREAIGEADWKTKAAPALSSSQDEAVKTLIAKVQASL